MRSTKAGVVIGKALEDGECKAGGGCKVLIMVHTTYSTGALLKVAYRDHGILFDAIEGDTNIESDVARAILAQMLQEKTNITATSTSSEIFTDRVVASLEIISPRVLTDVLVANTIEAVEKDLDIKVIQGGRFVIKKVSPDGISTTFGEVSPDQDTSIVSIDDLGNALFSGSLTAVNLEIGSPDQRGGITMYDTETGEPYCTKVTSGALKTTPGKCTLGPSNPLLQNSSSSDEQSADMSTEGSPVITVNGDNPANINIGDTYSDLCATVSDDQDNNLGIHTFLNGEEVQNITLDTGTSTTYNIVYKVTDSDGNTGEATRTVVVGQSSVAASS